MNQGGSHQEPQALLNCGLLLLTARRGFPPGQLNLKAAMKLFAHTRIRPTQKDALPPATINSMQIDMEATKHPQRKLLVKSPVLSPM